MKLFNIQYPLYFPDEDPVVTDMDVLNEDDDSKDEDEDTDDLPELEDEEDDDTTEDDDEEVDKKDEKDEKDEEVKDEELVRISARALREKHPEIFKEFPQLKNTIYREQEYTKIFSNPKDAEEALNDQEHLSNLRSLVLSGDAEQIIGSIKEVNDKSLKSFAEGFLPALQKVDRDTYIEITKPVIRSILRSVMQFGKEHDDSEKGKNFINAAKVVSLAVFQDSDLGKPDEVKKKTVDEDLEKDKNEFYSKKANDLATSVNNDVEEELDDLIGDIDPTKVLEKRPTLKAKILADIKREVREAMGRDKAHMTKMDSLWARERRNGFEGTLKDSIKTTFLSRAKVLIPEIRKRVRSEYLGVTKDNDKKLKARAEGRDKNLNPGTQTSSKTKVPTAKEAKAKGLSAMDILNA